MSQSSSAATTVPANIKTNTSALATLVIVFFFGDLLLRAIVYLYRFCRTHFSLTQFESQLIGSAFYGAYFIGSLILYLVSSILGYDILNRIGYKKGIIWGL
jgi:FHS family L-fucose permease-like MFS transporter